MGGMVANRHKQQIPPLRFAPVGMTNKKTPLPVGMTDRGNTFQRRGRQRVCAPSSQGRHGGIDSRANAGGPARCHCFEAHVKADSLWSVDGVVAEQGTLPSAEAVERHGDGDWYVDAYHPDLY